MSAKPSELSCGSIDTSQSNWTNYSSIFLCCGAATQRGSRPHYCGF